MRNKILILVVLVSFSVFASAGFATNYLDVYGGGVVQPGGNISITGGITNTSGSNPAGVNISANISGSFGSAVSSSSGAVNYNISAPAAVGEYNISIFANCTSSDSCASRTITIYVSNITTGSITYLGSNPPFSRSQSFTVNITLKNGTAVFPNYRPEVKIFSTNGQEKNWAISTAAGGSDLSGNKNYTITVNALASSGQYAIVVDRGAIIGIFNVRSSYTSTALTHASGDDTQISTNFAPGNNVSILSKITSVSTGSGVAAASAIAYITLPNNTIRTLSLTARNQTEYPGYFNNSFTETSAAGAYNVRAVQTVGSETIESYTIFSTKRFSASLEPQTEFFMEWGGTAAFAAGKPMGLNIIATNLSDNSLFTVGGSGANSISACDGSVLKFVDVLDKNGTSINSTITGVAWATGRYMMNQVCRVQFNAPTASGTYGIKINVTLGGTIETITKYFYVQKYFLKASNVMGTGGEMEFMQMTSPGQNTTIQLSAFNVSSGQDLYGPNISSIVVEKIIPLEAMMGSTEITSGINYTVTLAATQLDKPSVELTVPESIQGPAMVQVRAAVGGETIRGSAFFVSNYLMGFLGPQGSSGGGQGEMKSFASCSGTKTFMGNVMEVKSNSVAQGVIANNLAKIRSEDTGKDMSSYITLTANGTSTSTGAITINISFSTALTYSGFYFGIINATYKGKTAGIPMSFMCKNLDFFPIIYSAGSSVNSWRISPDSPVNIIISNITRLNDTKKIANATLSFSRAMNFNPSSGGMSMLTSSVSFWINYTNGTGGAANVTSNMFNVTLYPQNFTLGGTVLQKWPNGFIDLQPVIATESLGGTYPSWSSDSGFGGFMVSAFDAWVGNFNWNEQIAVNSSKSYTINTKTNVSTSGANITVKIGRPWEGSLTTISGVSATLLDDRWNTTADWGTEQWNVTFTVPATIKKGETMIIFTVNNSQGETIDVDTFTTLTKYNVYILAEEGIQNWEQGNTNNEQEYINQKGWNLTKVNETFGIWSKSNPRTAYNKTGLTITRYGQTEQTIVYNTTVKMLLIDNTTAGTCDTLVFNSSTGDLSYVNLANRKINSTAVGTDSLYLKSIEGCGFVKIVNASVLSSGFESNWGGSFQANSEMAIPYVVKLGSNPLPNMNVGVNSIIKQTDQGGHSSAGFGFEGKLSGRVGTSTDLSVSSGQNYTYLSTTTDSQGVAFLKMNITNSGRFNMFWKINSSIDVDVASMSSGTNIEVKRFDAYAQVAYNLPQGVVTLQYSNNTNSTWDAYNVGQSSYVYNGTVNETSTTGFIRDSLTTTPWYIVFNPTLNHTTIDDDSNLSSSAGDITYSPISNWLNDSLNIPANLGASDGQKIAIGKIQWNTTPTGSINVSFFQSNPSDTLLISTSNSNISVYVCAQGYEKPIPSKKEGYGVKLYMEEFGMMGSTKKYLNLFDPINQSIACTGGNTKPSTTDIKLGPNGCVGFIANHTTGWASGCNGVQGIVTDTSGNEENIWIGWACLGFGQGGMQGPSQGGSMPGGG